jgi:DNA replication protein DnaC
MAIALNNLENILRQLKLDNLADHLEKWLQDAAKQEWSYAEFLEKLLSQELSEKYDKRTEYTHGKISLYEDYFFF